MQLCFQQYNIEANAVMCASAKLFKLPVILTAGRCVSGVYFRCKHLPIRFTTNNHFHEMFIAILFKFVLLIILNFQFTSSALIPVIYVLHGEVPNYLLVNIELASRRNPVILLSDSHNNLTVHGFSNFQSFKIDKYSEGAKQFAPHYKHYSKDHSAKRIVHELRCIQRWFVLSAFMNAHGIEKAFFGDGDSSVFANITQVSSYRPDCDGVINIEIQYNRYHWVGAGEASVWNRAAISDFVQFASSLYQFNQNTLRLKADKGSSVVDMSSLWLWYVAHKNTSVASWDTGRPYNPAPLHNKPITPMEVEETRRNHDLAFEYTRTLQLPSVNPAVNVCNGMDVVNRTAFDHMHGFHNGKGFSFDFDGDGIPYLVDISLYWGGKPESVEPDQVAILEKKRLHLNNIHFQGGSKDLLIFDVCRVLTRSGNRIINSPTVSKICDAELRKYKGVACRNHSDVFEGKFLCF